MESRKTVFAALICKRLKVKWLYSISDDLTKVLFCLYMTKVISFGLNCESHSPYFHVLYIPLKCRTVFILFDSRSGEFDVKSGMVSMERNNSIKLFLWYVISKNVVKPGYSVFIRQTTSADVVWLLTTLSHSLYIDIVFAQSLSNFTCELWMIRRGTLLIWGHGVKGQGQLWHSSCKTLWTQYRLPPWGRRGFKSRIRPPYPERVVKGD